MVSVFSEFQKALVYSWTAHIVSTTETTSKTTKSWTTGESSVHSQSQHIMGISPPPPCACWTLACKEKERFSIPLWRLEPYRCAGRSEPHVPLLRDTEQQFLLAGAMHSRRGPCSIPSALSGISAVCAGALLILRDCGYCWSAECVSTEAISLYAPSLAQLCGLWPSPKWIYFFLFPHS